MVEEEQRLKAEIAELLQKAEEADQAEDDRFGPHLRGDELPEELRFREQRLAKVQEAKAALEGEARLRAGVDEHEPPEGPEPKGSKGAVGGSSGRQNLIVDPEN